MNRARQFGNNLRDYLDWALIAQTSADLEGTVTYGRFAKNAECADRWRGVYPMHGENGAISS